MAPTAASKVAASYVALCAETLRKILARTRPDGNRHAHASRERIVAVLELALARRERRVALTRRLSRVGTLAVAAGVVVVFGWIWLGSSGAKDRRSASGGRGDRAFTVLGASTASGTAIEGLAVVAGEATRRPLKDGMTLEPGTGLVAPPTNEVRVGTPDGTVLTLERAGELTIVEQDTTRRFSLRRGAVRARVSKLQDNERFIITTDDAEIEVHGTTFRIAVVPPDPACGAGVRTRVTVSEGVVSVRTAKKETLVPAGGVWPSGCNELVTALEATRVGATSVVPASRGTPGRDARDAGPIRRSSLARAAGAAVPLAKGPTGPGPAAIPQPESVLAVQNDLFLAAIRAKNQQHPRESVQLFSRLIDQYPAGPLVEGAMVQRFQVLRLIDEGAAVRAASQYLSRFPGGYARAEATELAGSGS